MVNSMIMQADTFLGKGIFTPAEAAFFARVRTQTMARWLFGDKRGGRVIMPEFSGQDEKVVSFLDFVQALAIRAIRVRHKVPLQRIRQAYEEAQSKYDVEYPFAARHTTFLLGDTHTIVIRLGDDDYRELAGPSKGNRMITQVVEPYLHDLRFEGKLASEYCAWPPRAGDETRRVIMNPRLSFGEPTVTTCGYTAQTLWEAYEIEGGTKAAANAFGISTDDVELTCEYYDHLQGTSAA